MMEPEPVRQRLHFKKSVRAAAGLPVAVLFQK